MTNSTPFLQMFSDYQPPEELHSLLSQAAVVAADIFVEDRRIALAIHAPAYISRRSMDTICKDLCALYGLRHIGIEPKYPTQELFRIDSEELRQFFVEENSMNRGSLAGAQWRWDNSELTIKLLANGKKELEKCVPAVQKKLLDMFDARVSIAIEAGEELTKQALFEKMEKMRQQVIATLPQAAPAQPKKEQPQQSDTMYGKPFMGPATPMKELSLDMGFVIVEGRVFAVEHKELKKRNAWVINFDMTDNTGSIRISRFLENNEAKPFLENVKVGSVLRVQGKIMVNNFDNEMVLKPYGMTSGTMPKRLDTAEGGKRVELHLHTVMSNMDALTVTKDAIKQAAAWGHKAIAITDHGCVQSFTDALHTVEDWKGAPKVAGTDEDIKVLYGCEGYYVNDMANRIVVQGTQDIPLTGEYVAFDLETY